MQVLEQHVQVLEQQVQVLEQAVEKLIGMVDEKDALIRELRKLQESTNYLLKALSETVLNMEKRVEGLEILSSQTTTHIQSIKDKQELIQLDSGAEHHLRSDRDEVVQEWLREDAAGFNSDMIPYADHEIKEGMRILQTKRTNHGRPAH